jgi:hypothetical protein
MLSTERMKLNYREFPDRIRQIFPQLVSDAPTPPEAGRCRLLRDSEEPVELPSR